MKFKVDFNERLSFIKMALVSSELFLLAVMHFITWDFPSNTYFRGLAVNVACVFLFAYLHEEENR